ncbi:hypothetical protein CSB93_2924 [Pseudomonas paraeruginosa]|uniref:Uncharacterized protein n=1 Tax=Pseudomonas paraeruginosa TaxID=2994495 RepID=A0A2R3J256_9PSED|nr:hypothetical protein CSB93_2924 [Pseudomonas paraeruginosa]AWE89650.1 hypothetical protein CSC28_1697 [Pseudomonas paraeruginosa]
MFTSIFVALPGRWPRFDPEGHIAAVVPTFFYYKSLLINKL